MDEYFSRLKQQTIDGLREFSEHPIKYTSHAALEFAKNYWDAAAIILGGCAFDDYHNKIFGNAREYIILGGVTALTISGFTNENRLLRNAYVGLSALFGFPFIRGAEMTFGEQLANGACFMITTTASGFLEYKRKQKKNTFKRESETSLDKTLS
mgnify:CR=1 FL=1